jgi:hypothetical protein
MGKSRVRVQHADGPVDGPAWYNNRDVENRGEVSRPMIMLVRLGGISPCWTWPSLPQVGNRCVRGY